MTDDPRRVYRRATELDPRTAAAIRAEVRARASGSGVGAPLVPLAAAWLLAAAVAAVVHGLRVEDRPVDGPIPNVNLAMRGQGSVGGTERAPIVQWVDGTVGVEVTPHQGIDLVVSTPEARIEVVGTKFVVDRSHRATSVTVTEGTVHVTCTGGDEVPVTVGESRRCLPSQPSELLLRLADLHASGGSADERLETATIGLARVDPSSPLRQELLAHEVRALTDAGRRDEALAAAELYLAAPGSRGAEVASFVARTRYEREGCGAVPALERAVREDPNRAESLLLAACVVDTAPERALSLVEAADGWATGEWRQVADQLRARLADGAPGGGPR